MRTHQKLAMLFAASTLLNQTHAIAKSYCAIAINQALATAAVAIRSHLRSNLSLSIDDELTVSLLKEPETLCLSKLTFPGPRYFLNYQISAHAKRKSDNLQFIDTREKSIDGALMISYAMHPPAPYSCELKIEWVDSPAMKDIVTGSTKAENEETIPNQLFWKILKSSKQSQQQKPDPEAGVPDCQTLPEDAGRK